MTATWALALVVLAPLCAAAVSFARPSVGTWAALVTVGAVAAGVQGLGSLVLGTGVVVHRLGGWSAPLGIDLRVDGFALFMLLVTAVVSVVVSLYAPAYFAGSGGRKLSGFWPPFLMLWSALNALFVSSDIFNLYFTLELLALAAVSLVALAGTRPALRAALRYLFVSLAASLFFLLGVALIYGHHATVDLELLAEVARPGPLTWVAAALMIGGLMAKAALFPLHFWLPPAHANAPVPVSALLSALVVKGAVYIIVRLWFDGLGAVTTPMAAQLLGALGAAAIFWGSAQALRAPRLKLLVAYSTVAQLGYLFLLVPLADQPTDGFVGCCWPWPGCTGWPARWTLSRAACWRRWPPNIPASCRCCSSGSWWASGSRPRCGRCTAGCRGP